MHTAFGGILAIPIALTFGRISGQPGKGAGIQAHLLKDLEFGGHSGEVAGQVAKLITGRYLRIEVEVSLRDAKSCTLQFSQRG